MELLCFFLNYLFKNTYSFKFFYDINIFTGVKKSLLQEDLRTGGKREKLEDIALKLRQVEVLQGQGKPLADVVRQIGVKSAVA